MPAQLYVIFTAVITFVGSLIVFQIIRFTLKKLQHYEDIQEIFRAVLPFTLLLTVILTYLSANFTVAIAEVWNKVFQITVIVFASWLVISLLGAGKTFITRKYDLDQEDNLNARKVHTQIRLFSRIISIVVLILAFSLILMTFKAVREVGASILASAGILSIIIGVAAQRLIANFLAGLQIAITQPIRIDDAVVIEGEWGWIEEITLTYVVVRIWDRRRLVLPTTQIIEKPFQNWTRNSSEILGTVIIYADYTVPVDELRKEFDRILDATHLWDGQIKVVQVTDATEKSMQIRFLMSAKNSPTAWDLRVHVREKLIEYLQKNHPGALPRARIELNQLGSTR